MTDESAVVIVHRSSFIVAVPKLELLPEAIKLFGVGTGKDFRSRIENEEARPARWWAGVLLNSAFCILPSAFLAGARSS